VITTTMAHMIHMAISKFWGWVLLAYAGGWLGATVFVIVLDWRERVHARRQAQLRCGLCHAPVPPWPFPRQGLDVICQACGRALLDELLEDVVLRGTSVDVRRR
jgi:hypothetical protein